MLGVGTTGPLALDDGPRGLGPPALARPAVAPVASVVTNAERDAWAVLAAIDGLGPVGFAALLARYGSALTILAESARPGAADRLAGTQGIERDGRRWVRFPIDPGLAVAIVEGVQRGPVVLGRLRETGVAVVTMEEPSFPACLADIPFPPHVLFLTGAVGALSRPRAVAVVGTRRATMSGRTTAARIARALVTADATVISGLAYGIDGAAHEATIRAGGHTVAVIGGGHAWLGPRPHTRLADAILAAGGAVVSEYAPDVQPTQGTFPRRNRIISGLSSATVIVEAPARSGALITASWAMEQGRSCFVVPGPMDAQGSEGGLALLREFPDVVRVVAGIPQLIADLGFAGSAAPVAAGRRAPSEDVASAALDHLGAAERSVATQLLAGHRTVDEVVAMTDLTVATVLATLALLERRGLAAGRHGRYRPDGDLLGAVSLPKAR
ncbi:MAG: DNA-processing protein DprA [Candidatus Limnocylindrales bacterium]